MRREVLARGELCLRGAAERDTNRRPTLKVEFLNFSIKLSLMNKLLLSFTLGLVLGIPAYSQEPVFPPGNGPLQTETIAAISTHSGTLVLADGAPLAGDNRPNSRFLLQAADGSLTPILVPGNSEEQDEIINNLLSACIGAVNGERDLSVVVSGSLVKHTNALGERTSLVIQHLEVDVRQEIGIHQKVTFTFSKN